MFSASSPTARVIRSGALPPIQCRSADPAKILSQFIVAVLVWCSGAGRQTLPGEGLIPSETLCLPLQQFFTCGDLIPQLKQLSQLRCNPDEVFSISNPFEIHMFLPFLK